uniref:EF-hand domain-containing protein n=1 Tax=Macrostomum lignano TaxID=282301 RepID=A0A1I8HPU3_9PLAT
MMHCHRAALAAILFCCLTGCFAPPVVKKPAPTVVAKKPGPADDLLKAYSPDDYKKYVEEVMAHLHMDKHFKSEWEKFKNSTHKAGDLASQLEFVDHSVRTRLDEIKRNEVDRLNALEKMLEAKKAAAGNPMREAGVPIHPDVFNMDQETIKKAHLDHENPHSFEASDLEKLIHQVVSDMHRVDEAKQEQYKQYEMMKEHLRLRKLHKINDTKAREAAEKEYQEEKKKHKQHEKIHHPGSSEQLRDAWADEDHMDKDSFNPKTFFLLHDVNGDGHLDVNEIEALFLKELEKAYNRTNDTTVNALEKQHEMERMRQEVLDKVDTNKDMMISWDEFERWTKNPDFKKDDDWKTSEEDDAPPYKDDEFKQFEDDYDREHPDDDEDLLGGRDRDRRDRRDRDDRDSREHDDHRDSHK